MSLQRVLPTSSALSSVFMCEWTHTPACLNISVDIKHAYSCTATPSGWGNSATPFKHPGPSNRLGEGKQIWDINYNMGRGNGSAQILTDTSKSHLARPCSSFAFIFTVPRDSSGHARRQARRVTAGRGGCSETALFPGFIALLRTRRKHLY